MHRKFFNFLLKNLKKNAPESVIKSETDLKNHLIEIAVRLYRQNILDIYDRNNKDLVSIQEWLKSKPALSAVFFENRATSTDEDAKLSIVDLYSELLPNRIDLIEAHLQGLMERNELFQDKERQLCDNSFHLPDEDTRKERIDRINNYIKLRANVLKKYGANFGEFSYEEVQIKSCTIGSEVPVIKNVKPVNSFEDLINCVSDVYNWDLTSSDDITKTKTEKEIAKRRCDIFKTGSGINDVIAVISRQSLNGTPWWDAKEFDCWSMDYATYCWLLDFNKDKNNLDKKLLVPGSNTLIFCDLANSSTNKGSLASMLLMQRRPMGYMGGNNRGRLSLAGGAVRPRWRSTIHDGTSKALQRCLIREVVEETGIVVTLHEGMPVLRIDEPRQKGQCQFSFLACNTSLNDHWLAKPKNDVEGYVEAVDFISLEDELMKKTFQWSSHSIAVILAWLAFETPGANHPKFGDKDAIDLFNIIVNQTSEKLIEQAKEWRNDSHFNNLCRLKKSQH